MRLKTGEASFNIVLDGNTITKANTKLYLQY